MAGSLLELMEELLQSIEQRDAGDPDAPAWEASARIEALEAELSRRLASGETASEDALAAHRRDGAVEALAGV
jgi:hypothetical protein